MGARDAFISTNLPPTRAIVENSLTFHISARETLNSWLTKLTHMGFTPKYLDALWQPLSLLFCSALIHGTLAICFEQKMSFGWDAKCLLSLTFKSACSWTAESLQRHCCTPFDLRWKMRTWRMMNFKGTCKSIVRTIRINQILHKMQIR